MTYFFMSPPRPEFHLQGRANFRSGVAAPVDAARAQQEWLGLAAQIEDLGGTVVVLESPDPDLTGMPFAAEAGHPLPPRNPGGRPRFLLPRVRPEHRRKEREHWGPFMEKLGFELIDPQVGYWEGQGDVAHFDGATLLFHGGRSDRIGVQAVRGHFEGEVLEVEIRDPAFHGNMAVLPLAHAGVILVAADVVEDDAVAVLEARFGRDRMHLVSEEEAKAYATNSLPVQNTVLAAAELPPRVRKLLEREGVTVKELDLAELCGKAGGAARCLVCIHEGDIPGEIPEEHRLDAFRARLATPS